MGNGMNKILPGLYVGNIRDSKDAKQLSENGITHILSIHDNAKKILEDKEYLCIIASDNAQQDLIGFFSQCNDFIHNARLNKGSVLVHCLAGVSRSVTVTAAYLMTITNLTWREALNAIRGSRNCANPNFGFQRQLQTFQMEGITAERRRLKEKFPVDTAVAEEDEKTIRRLLQSYQNFVLHGTSDLSEVPTSKNDPDDGLYPLPYNAYSDRRSGVVVAGDEDADDAGVSEGGSDSAGAAAEAGVATSSHGNSSSAGVPSRSSGSYASDKPDAEDADR